MQPTISPKPTTSLSPTQGPQCEGSNPNTCGCGSVGQADYRGTINTTITGKECIRWDETSWKPEDYPDAGLEDNNYCRKPDGHRDDRVWCYTADGSREDCDVPYCFPPKSSCPSVFVSSMSKELQAACAYHQCVDDSWYVSGDYQTLTRSEIKPDCACAYEVWDCKFGSKRCKPAANGITSEHQALKNDYDCCAIKSNDSSLTMQEASCECLIKPSCDDSDSEKCNDFAKYCCQEDDQQCKCEYQTKACRLALESDNEQVSAMAGDYCGTLNGGGAQSACCGEDNNDGGLCNCDFWEPLCTDFPNAVGNVDACALAGGNSCCIGSYHCFCDFFTHAVEALGYEDESDYAGVTCAAASNIAPDNGVELQSLQNIYNETGGDYWYNNTGWTTEQDQCNWYGITCDEEDYVIEINLPNNNITGKFPSNSLSSFYNLQRLDLGNNDLIGMMAGTNEFGKTDASLFFNLRDLARVDLSQNKLNGEVDVLFAPALQYANFSNNNFTSINGFKEFKRSQQTLTVCDVSHNSINTSTSDLMKNVPPNVEELILWNNLIHGPLPKSLEEATNLRQFDLSMNALSGELPDFSSVYPNLQVLDLSNRIGEGLVGNIPESLANLPFLSTLNFAGNQLSNIIPPVLGNMGQLRVLNLSNNKLSQTIPKELGNLGEFVLISYMHFVLLYCR